MGPSKQTPLNGSRPATPLSAVPSTPANPVTPSTPANPVTPSISPAQPPATSAPTSTRITTTSTFTRPATSAPTSTRIASARPTTGRAGYMPSIGLPVSNPTRPVTITPTTTDISLVTQSATSATHSSRRKIIIIIALVLATIAAIAAIIFFIILPSTKSTPLSTLNTDFQSFTQLAVKGPDSPPDDTTSTADLLQTPFSEWYLASIAQNMQENWTGLTETDLSYLSNLQTTYDTFSTHAQDYRYPDANAKSSTIQDIQTAKDYLISYIAYLVYYDNVIRIPTIYTQDSPKAATALNERLNTYLSQVTSESTQHSLIQYMYDYGQTTINYFNQITTAGCIDTTGGIDDFCANRIYPNDLSTESTYIDSSIDLTAIYLPLNLRLVYNYFWSNQNV